MHANAAASSAIDAIRVAAREPWRRAGGGAPARGVTRSPDSQRFRAAGGTRGSHFALMGPPPHPAPRLTRHRLLRSSQRSVVEVADATELGEQQHPERGDADRAYAA